MRLLLFVTLLAAARMAVAYEPQWDSYSGRRIGDVQIDAYEIFDSSVPEENRLLFNWANALHVRTKERVIERELLFRPGEPFRPLLVEESERNLRRLGVFQDVRVRVVPRDDDLVDVMVRTDDRWATRVITDISRQGDIVRFRLGLENTNFLGWATQFGGSVFASNDIDAYDLNFREPRVFGSRLELALSYAEDELSYRNFYRLRRPYFSEFVRWSAEAEYQRRTGERRAFFNAARIDTFELSEETVEFTLGLHGVEPYRSRLGLLVSHRELRSDIDSRQTIIGLTWSWLQRDYWQLENIDFFGTSEDIATGWTFQLGAGADFQALGAHADRPFWRADFAVAAFLNPDWYASIALRQHGLLADDRVENARWSAESTGFFRSPRQTLAWSLGFAALVREPEHLRFALGGDERLRGYGARRQTGTRAMWLNLEERLFSDWRLFFLQFGGVVFVDAGQAWDHDRKPALNRWDTGVGLGLRIGNQKSGSGMFRIDAAWGRGSFEFAVSSGSFFRVGRDLDFIRQGLY